MRPIDADALPRHGKRGGVVYWKDIESAPTIDAVPMDDYMELHNHFVNWQPVRRGKWVVAGETTHYYICSICGKPGDGFDNYCRGCGALMDIIQGKADK